MRKRRLAAAAAITVSATSILPSAAHADAAATTTIYVKSSSTACSDAGTGTQAVPFCTLQAGIDAAAPGDTVSVGAGTYRPAAFTRSGTATAPISVVATTSLGARIVPATGSTAAAFTFTNVSYISVSNFYVPYPAAQYAYVTGSNHITIDRLAGQTSTGTQSVSYTSPGIEITGDSSSVTVSRSQLDEPLRTAPAIQIDAGSTGNTITTNYILNGTILATDAPGTDVTGNTLNQPTIGGGFGTGIALTGASTGSSIENNVIEPASDNPATAAALIEVDSAATSGTVEDYNNLGTTTYAASGTPNLYGYEWAGKFYPNPTALHIATGQASHDLIGAYGAASTIANNADSAAPANWRPTSTATPASTTPSTPRPAPGPTPTTTAAPPRSSHPQPRTRSPPPPTARSASPPHRKTGRAPATPTTSATAPPRSTARTAPRPTPTPTPAPTPSPSPAPPPRPGRRSPTPPRSPPPR